MTWVPRTYLRVSAFICGLKHPGLPLVRIDHLYTVIAVATTTIAVSLMVVPPNDLWWHMRIGQVIAEEGRIPTTNMFAWSIPEDTPQVYAAWLGELLLYGVYTAGDWPAVILARNALALLTFAIVGIEAQRRSGSWKLAGLAVALAGLMGINNVVIRPQIWSWLPFVLFLLLLRRYADRALGPRWLVALPLLMLFWVNVHGAFILGLLMVGAVVVGETARSALRQAGALDGRALIPLYGAGIGTALATLANPQGIGIVAYVHDLVTDAPSQRLIVEWQPPAPRDVPNGVFFASILLLLVAVAYGRSAQGKLSTAGGEEAGFSPSPTPRISLTDMLLVCGFLWLAWSGMRYVFWYGLVAMPTLAQWLASGHAAAGGRAYPRQSGLANALIAACVALAAILTQPWFVRALPLPAAYFERMLPPPTPPFMDVETPLAAAGYLRNQPGGKLFNQMGYGSYLIWALPGRPVFIDPRVELYPFQQWEDYIEISNGRRAPELLEQYGADRVLLSLQAQPKLSQALAASPAWEREYADQWSEIWRRT